jgi:hypothetical protein
MLDGLAANLDGFLSRDTYVSSLSFIGAFGTKREYLYLEIQKFQDILLSKTNSILTGKECIDAAASNIDGYLWRNPCVSSSQPNSPICSKQRLPPLSDT